MSLSYNPEQQGNLSAFGGGTAPAASPPTTGMNPMAAMALMSMMGGNKDKGSATQTYGDTSNYNGGGGQPYMTQRDPQQLAYQQAIMTALMGGGR